LIIQPSTGTNGSGTESTINKFLLLWLRNRLTPPPTGTANNYSLPVFHSPAGSCILELNLDYAGVSLFLYRPSARRSFRSKPSLHPKVSGFFACLSPYGTGFSWQSVRFYTWPQDFSIKFSCQSTGICCVLHQFSRFKRVFAVCYNFL